MLTNKGVRAFELSKISSARTPSKMLDPARIHRMLASMQTLGLLIRTNGNSNGSPQIPMPKGFNRKKKARPEYFVKELVHLLAFRDMKTKMNSKTLWHELRPGILLLHDVEISKSYKKQILDASTRFMNEVERIWALYSVSLAIDAFKESFTNKEHPQTIAWKTKLLIEFTGRMRSEFESLGWIDDKCDLNLPLLETLGLQSHVHRIIDNDGIDLIDDPTIKRAIRKEMARVRKADKKGIVELSEKKLLQIKEMRDFINKSIVYLDSRHEPVLLISLSLPTDQGALRSKLET